MSRRQDCWAEADALRRRLVKQAKADMRLVKSKKIRCTFHPRRKAAITLEAQPLCKACGLKYAGAKK